MPIRSLSRTVRHYFMSRRAPAVARWASVVSLGVLSNGSLAVADTASTLTGLGTTNEDVPVNHGSNAEVTLIWDNLWDQYAEWDGRGDVYQVDQPITTVKFVPTAANISVRVGQFDLDEWKGGGDTSARWSVVGSTSGLLASGNWDTFNTVHDPNDQGGRSLVTPGASGIAGESLTLSIDHTATGTGSYLALDNLAFSSHVVPEPTTGALLATATGLGALAMRRRHSRAGDRA